MTALPSSQTQSLTQTSQKPTKAKFPCLRCKKNVAKNSKSVKCNICQNWVHVECEGMPAEFYNLLANQEKYGMSGVYWNCAACQTSAAKITEMMGQYENRVKEVEDRMTAGEAEIKQMGKEVKKVVESLHDRDDKIDQKLQKAEKCIYEELKQRDTRRANAIMHGVAEIGGENPTGGERRDWDRKECLAILEALRMGLDDRDIKFTRRLGDKPHGPRPLCVGFYSDADRDRLLRRARDLDKTKFKEVSICADLTWKQRTEEADMAKEAARRNEKDLTEEDKAKNLHWAAVGAKGQKRLVKTAARPQQEPRTRQSDWSGRDRNPPRNNRSPRRTNDQEEQRRGLRRARSENSQERVNSPPSKK